MSASRSPWLLLVLASAALGQARPVEEKKAAAIAEIERGFFFEGRGGFWATLGPPALPGGATYFSPGQAAQVDLGFDLGEWVSPSLFVLVTGNRMRSDYTGLSGGTASGDYAALIPGVGLKVRVAGFEDAQSVKRTWLYLRAAGGVILYYPAALIGRLDVLVSGGAGIEYFTRLRHFSIGLEANFNFMALTSTFGFSVLPTVKYSF